MNLPIRRSAFAGAISLLLLGAGLSSAEALAPPSVTQTDYQANIPATSLARFNSTNPPGSTGFIFPSIEKNSLTGDYVLSVVYVKGSTISIRYQVYNPNGVALQVTFAFTSPMFCPQPPDPVIQLGGEHVETVTIDPASSHDFVVQVSGFPGTVALGWLMTEINISSEAGGAASNWPWPEEFIYFTDGPPVAPMAVPWTDVLADACTWANGQSGADACSKDLPTGEAAASSTIG